MRNPLLTKNPFLSMWLSGANTVFSAARGKATAEAQRQATRLMAEGVRQTIEFWSGGLATPVSKRRKRTRS